MTAVRNDERDLGRVFRALGVVLSIIGALVFVFGRTSRIARTSFPFDFNLNWIGARRLIRGEDIYDSASASTQAVALLGREMVTTNPSPFVRFIGPPSTALLHVPFLGVDHDTAVTTFRVLTVLLIVASVFVTARLLPKEAQLGGCLLSLGALLVSFPLANTIALGQGNGFVMISLALGVWGATRERWAVAGIGLGLATVLKISPVLLVVYLVLRGRRLPAYWAASTAIAVSCVAAIAGRPIELWIWLRDVAPDVGRGSLQVFNQSVVGWVARLTAGTDADLADQSVLGRHWGIAANLVAAVLLVILWRKRRNFELIPLELGAVIVIALLVGPLSWEHYLVWAFIPFTLCFDPTLWTHRTRRATAAVAACLAIGTYLLTIPLQIVWLDSRGTEWAPWVTSPGTLAALLFFVAMWQLLTPTGASRHPGGEASPTEVPRTTATPPGAMWCRASVAKPGAPRMSRWKTATTKTPVTSMSTSAAA